MVLNSKGGADAAESTRLLELLHYREHRLAYKKRTEIALEIVRQLEAEGHFPQSNYAFDHGLLNLPLTREVEQSGKHWVSKLESSRHIQWEGQGLRVDELAAELRREHPERRGQRGVASCETPHQRHFIGAARCKVEEEERHLRQAVERLSGDSESLSVTKIATDILSNR